MALQRSTRPVRSVLYTPASNPRVLDKARGLASDAVIIDLEDAVAPDAKEQARANAVEAVQAGGFGDRIVTVRSNGIDTPWGLDDIAAIAAAAPDAIVLPKVSSAAELQRSKAALHAANGAAVRIWPMIETPGAVLGARELAADPDVDVFVMGTNDLLLELRAAAVASRAPLLPHLAHALLAARAGGVRIVDGVFNDIADLDGFAAECRQGVELGFDGKTLIHPAQVEPCNAAWSPSAAEVAHARRVIEAFAAARAEGRGVATLDGRMIENLHVAMAERVLALADDRR